MPDKIERRILLEQQATGLAELFVFCPLFRGEVELGRCVACEFYRGLSPRTQACHVYCRYPDALFGHAATGGASS